MTNFFRIFFYSCLFYAAGISAAHAQVITTIAGNGYMGQTGDGGPALLAELYLPTGLAVDSAGNVYIGTSENEVRKVNTAGIITTYAGNGLFGTYIGDGGPATAVSLSEASLATDRHGNLYIGDWSHNRVRKVDTAGIITTIAGNSTPGYSGDGGPATAAKISGPDFIATDQAGNVYISCDSGNVVRKVSTAGIITTIAGNGTAGYSGDGGPATAAMLNGPFGLSVDRAGNLYINDYNNYRIRKVDTAGIITTYAGNGTAGYSGDGGPATAAECNHAYGICADIAGNLYISDEFNDAIRKVDAAGIITTIAGLGVPAWGGDGGPATAAYLAGPTGIARYGNGNLYFADSHNERIRMISVAPYFIYGKYQSAAFCSGVTVPVDTLLAANDSNSGITEHWSLISGPHHGTASVAYTATSTGSVVYPVGLTYSSTPGYIGLDTFMVRITDSIISDTTTVYITATGMPHAGTITGPDTVCWGKTIVLSDTTAGGTWSASNAHAFVIGGSVNGTTPGIDTIRYITTNICGADTAKYTVTVKLCPNAISTMQAPGDGIQLYPNPTTGTLNFILTSTYNEDTHIVITNLVGEKIKEITTATNRLTEIMMNAPTGVYFVNAVTAHGSWSEKVVVAK